MSTAAEAVPAFPVRKLDGARLSELARCPRMAAYRVLGEEPLPPTDVERRYFARGRMYGRFVAEQFAARYPDGVEFEREIPWGDGWTGHADVYVKPEKLLVEVVSTTSPSPLMIGFKIEQAKQYLHFDEEAERAAVYVIDPSKLTREDHMPVTLTDEDRERIDAHAAAVAETARGGELPGRVCAKPSEARAHLCPFAGVCFADWQEPPAEGLTPEAASLARDALERRLDLDKAKKTLQEFDEAYREATAELAEHCEPGVEYDAGDVKVRRTAVKGRTTYNVAAAIRCGIVDEELLAPFVRVGEPHDRWTIEPADGAPVVEDFGEEAPF